MPLPARSAADVHLADTFEAPGCPVWRETARAGGLWLESILAESVDDMASREVLDHARGDAAPRGRR